MKKLSKYKVKLNIRKEFLGCKPKEEVLRHNGKIITVRVLWTIDKDEFYSGEYALEPLDTKIGIGWIASGDVEVLSEVQE